MKLNLNLTEKQLLAFNLFKDNEIDENYFGGGAGGGKTFLGCVVVIIFCLRFKGIRAFVGRETWERLRESTQKTFFSTLKLFKLVKGKHYSYNQQTKTLKFRNGSEVIFGYLKYEPSDPDYDYLGSVEYTIAFLDEVQEISLKAKNVIKTRLRYLTKEKGIKGKLFLTFNPSKGWLYEVYDEDKNNNLPKNKAFTQALVVDNPFIDDNYIEALKNNDDKNIVERLFYGNWDYDNDPRLMMAYEDILEVFKNNSLALEDGDYFLISDVARMGKDTTTISVWKGWKMIEAYEYSKQDLKTTKEKILALKAKYNISTKNILIDEVGVGGGLVDEIKCKGFIANATAQDNPITKKKENYVSLKDQCAYRLAKRVSESNIAIYPEISKDIKERIVSELSILKTDSKDDKPLKVISKEKQKELLRCSPDWLDNLIMRCFFTEIKSNRVIAFISSR